MSGEGEASPWYVDTFRSGYLTRYPHRTEAEATGLVRMLGLTGQGAIDWRDQRVLDLACGAGRFVPALLDAGAAQVTGLDLSRDLLAVAGERLASSVSAGVVELIEGDMRAVPRAAGSFDVVTSFFTSFGYFDDDAENARVFDEVARLLRPGGWFVFDFLNAPVVIRDLEARTELLLPDGRGVVVHERSFDAATGRLRKVSRWPDGSEDRESVRAYEPEVLELMLAGSGLRVARRFGSYEGLPFDATTSSRFLVVAQRDQGGSKIGEVNAGGATS